jgi:hypothetical protein
MLKLSFIISLVFFFGCKSFDCSDYKNGKFLIHNPDRSEILVERKDSLQTETDLKTGFRAHVKITWVNFCEYDILELKTNLEKETIKDSFFKVNPIHVKIIAVGKDYYVYSSTLGIPGDRELFDTARVYK